MIKLSAACVRMLEELSEPNKNPDNVWYFPAKNLRTLRVLVRHGFARRADDGPGLGRYGFSITPLGLARLGRCPHSETIHGEDIPRRYGSYRSQVCRACGCFRVLTHFDKVSGPWQPASEYAEATASSEDE